MTIHFLTIVLDGMPWISMHYPVLRKLTFPWTWSVVEGVADNAKCTSWCKKLNPRLSEDGTSEYLKSISFDKRVRLCQRPHWNGKVEMVNAPLPFLTEPGLLWQIDSDELWTVEQINKARQLFLNYPRKNTARFYCRYYVGPDIVTLGKDSYGNNPDEWLRVWRYKPGMKFLSHEPPRLNIEKENSFSRDETYKQGLVFDHFAYATEAQLAFKQKYYGAKSGWYENAVADWKRLQSNTQWPVEKLKSFLPWVDENAKATRL